MECSKRCKNVFSTVHAPFQPKNVSVANTKPCLRAPLYMTFSHPGQPGPQPLTGLHPSPWVKHSSDSHACHSETRLDTWALRASSIQFFKWQCLLFSVLFFFFWGMELFVYRFLFVLVLWPCCTTCGVSVPGWGMEPTPPALEVQSLNHWIPRELPVSLTSGSRWLDHTLTGHKHPLW